MGRLGAIKVQLELEYKMDKILKVKVILRSHYDIAHPSLPNNPAKCHFPPDYGFHDIAYGCAVESS